MNRPAPEDRSPEIASRDLPPASPADVVPAEVDANGEALTPAARFARAQARLAEGREAAAREDLEASAERLGDAALIELAYLDLRQRGDLKGALRTARAVAERACEPLQPHLRARALHVMGMALDRLRRTSGALKTLLEAARLYEASGHDIPRAHVYDTIGTLHASRGRLDEATHYYALSLADKAALGDRRGLAVTIGNLGRVELRAGRYRDAIQCFDRDLAIATELGDVRAQARMHEDLGRAYAGLGDGEEAERHYLESLRLAEQHDLGGIAFYGHLDLAVLHLERDEVEDAALRLEAAASLPLAETSAYRLAMLDAVRGDLLLARGDEEGVDVLRRAVDGLVAADAPDLEIAARIRLARAYRDRGYPALAEETLLGGVTRARRAGYQRYLPRLNEAMVELEVVEPALQERPRRRTTEGAPADGAYVLLGRLGEGAFGEVFRAYDSQRGLEVALKVLHLERRYDPAVRQRVLHSARVELEAASRVRHPGVARVYAIGEEEDGGFYVVEELVPGRSLRGVMNEEKAPSVERVLAMTRRLAHALEALHEAGVVHRDLKPENVIVREDDTPVLVDFGVAHVGPAAAEPAALAGTLEYMAPEQARGAAVDGRADLYALGVILFEWLVGFRPLALAERPPESWQRVLQKESPPRLKEFLPDVSDDADALVADLLAKRPADRPATAAAVADRIAAATAS